jgi:hypothetical protein
MRNQNKHDKVMSTFNFPGCPVADPQMAGFEIPHDLQDFIRQRIDSVVQIEALLLISQSDSTRTWTIPEVARRLYISQAEAADALHRLCTADLLRYSGESYGLHGITSQNLSLIERLLALYKRHLIAITNFIHKKTSHPGTPNLDIKG